MIVDVDGVLSDASGRQHFLDGPTKDWWAFFEASIDDPPIPESIRLVEHLTENQTVVLLTARPSGSADTTLEWLELNGVRWDLLAMRNEDDHGSSPEVKRAILSELRSDGYEPLLAIDDDPGNLIMYRSEGVPTVYVHSGYYDA
ncbi:MAG: hypothetical protein ISR43_02805 [Acidimicrobiia bacterium]|nr:hypothetical protein [Actinomycetota bacterium]MBL6924564.1 hypothetical protein [Acidimicrobiia bacterium]MBL6926143.1 hypothetical protein [Acidimicrobiia bacterium]